MNSDKRPDYVLPIIPFQSHDIKLRIVSSYWLIIILGLPLWWITTSIERLALPVERVRSIARVTEVLGYPFDAVRSRSSTPLSWTARFSVGYLD